MRGGNGKSMCEDCDAKECLLPNLLEERCHKVLRDAIFREVSCKCVVVVGVDDIDG